MPFTMLYQLLLHRIVAYLQSMLNAKVAESASCLDSWRNLSFKVHG